MLVPQILEFSKTWCTKKKKVQLSNRERCYHFKTQPKNRGVLEFKTLVETRELHFSLRIITNLMISYWLPNDSILDFGYEDDTRTTFLVRPLWRFLTWFILSAAQSISGWTCKQRNDSAEAGYIQEAFISLWLSKISKRRVTYNLIQQKCKKKKSCHWRFDMKIYP
jgi:hypothetical protein